jgi:hypothetical protein
MLAMLPEHKLGVIVLSNSATSAGSVSKIASNALRLMLEAKTGIKQEAKAVIRSPERDPTPEELRFFNGHFDTLVGLAKISTGNGKIDANAVGHHFQLVPHEDGLLSVKYKVLGMVPVRVGAFEDIRLSTATVDGRQIIVGRIGNESLMFGEKLNPRSIPETFLQHYGQYEITGKKDGPLPNHIILKEDDGLLVGEARFPERPELLLRIGFQPISDTEAVTAGLGSGRGDTLRLIREDNEESLGFSGFQLRKISN